MTVIWFCLDNVKWACMSKHSLAYRHEKPRGCSGYLHAHAEFCRQALWKEDSWHWQGGLEDLQREWTIIEKQLLLCNVFSYLLHFVNEISAALFAKNFPALLLCQKFSYSFTNLQFSIFICTYIFMFSCTFVGHISYTCILSALFFFLYNLFSYTCFLHFPFFLHFCRLHIHAGNMRPTLMWRSKPLNLVNLLKTCLISFLHVHEDM